MKNLTYKNMKPTCLLPLAVAALLSTGNTHAATFIWTGADGATDATWENPLNWDGGTVPNGVAGQLSTSSASDVVIFDSETVSFMPSNFILTRNSFTGSFKNPQIQVLNGTVNFSNNLNWGWNTETFIVGDGDMTTLAVANTGFTELNRDPNGLKTYTVNADGTLIFRNNVTAFTNDGNQKQARVNLFGGTVRFDGTINNHLTNAANNYISFNALGSTFTADFGGQLPDISTIEAQLGNSFRFGGSLIGDPNVFLDTTDNGNGTFSIIAAIPEPSTALLSAFGILALLRRRRG
jgi:hypothetical protein